ncbi:MAG: hypothetical protein OXE53_08340 [Deltaproteobacteria bacterium]|nr:hypothetical protein [Deltaproteobacteria bacterium]
MIACPNIARAALRLAAAAWVAVALSGCAPSAIDARRPDFVAPQAIAGRTAAQAQLSLAHHRAYRELNVRAGAAPRPAASRGAFHQAYQRWLKGEVRKLPAPGETVPEAN